LKYRASLNSIAVLAGAVCLQPAWPAAQREEVARKMAHDIFKELIEINTTDSIGSTTVAAKAMAQRLLDAGFPAADVAVMGPNERKGNLIARYRGKAGRRLRPILIIGHLDVVEARPEDWTTDPFQFVEKDGYYYGRGTQDMKASDAIVVTDFIRLKQEGFIPDRDIILALTADEEGGTSNGVDWLLKNHRDLIDAEYALNPESSGVVTDHGKPLTVEVVATEKLYGDYQVLAANPGGHSSLPKPDNAIYHVADALAVLEKSPFPFELNSVTRAYFEQMAATLSGPTAADIRAMLATPARRGGGRAAVGGHALQRHSAHHLRGDHDERRARAERAAAESRGQRQLPYIPRTFARRDPPPAGGIVQRSGAHRSLPRRWRRAVGSWLGSQGDGAAAPARRRHGFAAQRGRKALAGCCRRPDHDDVGLGQRPYDDGGHPELRHFGRCG